MSHRPLRVLFVSHSLPPEGRPLANLGGMQRVATELYDALEAHGALDFQGRVLRSGYVMHHLRSPLFMYRTLGMIKRMAARDEIDVVLFSSMVTAGLTLLMRRTLAETNIKTAAIVHGRDVTLPSARYQKIVRRVFDSVDLVLPVSRATGAACLERGLPRAKCCVVPNGVDRSRFEALDDRAAMRADLLTHLGDPAHPLPEDALLLCSVGRQVERKGFAWFVDEVMPLFPEDVHYWLGGEGPETENIRAAIARHGLEQRVRLLGRISDEDLNRLYRGTDLFVMPNIPVAGDMEGFGVVMLEAGMSGLPTIAARLEGIQDVVTEGANGHLVESGDAWGFSEAVMQYYHDRGTLTAAATRAARHTADTFCWSAVADRYVAALQSLLPVPAPPPVVEDVA